MLYMVELEQLLKKDGVLLIDSNTKNSDKIIVFYKKGDNIPIEVFNVLHEYKSLQMMEKPTDPFLYGVLIGKIIAGKETEIFNLLSVKIPDVDNRYKQMRPVKTTAPVSSEDKPKRHRRTKAEIEAEKQSIPTITPKSDSAKEKTVSSDTSINRNEIKIKLQNSSNKTLAHIAKNEDLYKCMIKAVKDSSDKKIGLEQLLKIYMGKDIVPAIIDDLRNLYDDIKNSI